MLGSGQRNKAAIGLHLTPLEHAAVGIGDGHDQIKRATGQARQGLLHVDHLAQRRCGLQQHHRALHLDGLQGMHQHRCHGHGVAAQFRWALQGLHGLGQLSNQHLVDVGADEHPAGPCCQGQVHRMTVKGFAGERAGIFAGQAF